MRFLVQRDEGAEEFGRVAEIDLAIGGERAVPGAALALGLPEAKEGEAMRLDDDDRGEIEDGARDGRLVTDFQYGEVEGARRIRETE
jgi:hypothetical protein